MTAAVLGVWVHHGDVTSGLLPASLVLNAEQMRRAAATQAFINCWLATASAADVEVYVAAACATGDPAERAVWYRGLERANGHFGELTLQWLQRLTNGRPDG